MVDGEAALAARVIVRLLRKGQQRSNPQTNPIESVSAEPNDFAPMRPIRRSRRPTYRGNGQCIGQFGIGLESAFFWSGLRLKSSHEICQMPETHRREGTSNPIEELGAGESNRRIWGLGCAIKSQGQEHP
jgi:hypothetical protein